MKRIITLPLLLALQSYVLAISPIIGGGGGSGDALTTNPLSQFAATTSSQFKGVISDENAPDGASSKVIMALGSLSIASGKTATFSNTLTFAGTDGVTYTGPTTSATLARTDAANTFTGHQTIEGVASTGATGTGKFVFDNGPTITGHETIEGVTATGATGTGKFVFDTAPTFAAGSASASSWPKWTSGTVLTTPEAGAIEWDAASQYFTNNTTEGRMATANMAIFRLTGDSSAIGASIADFFGTGSAYPTVTNGVYEIVCDVFFTKTTAGTVTWTITNSQTYTNIVASYFACPAAGIGAISNAAHAGIDNTATAAAALPVTSSLSNATDQHYVIRALAEVGTSGTIKLQVTSSAGTVTPRRGSIMTVRRLPAGNVGAWQ